MLPTRTVNSTFLSFFLSFFLPSFLSFSLSFFGGEGGYKSCTLKRMQTTVLLKVSRIGVTVIKMNGVDGKGERGGRGLGVSTWGISRYWYELERSHHTHASSHFESALRAVIRYIYFLHFLSLFLFLSGKKAGTCGLHEVSGNSFPVELAHQMLDQSVLSLSLIHIWRCRRRGWCRSRWSPYH